MPLMTGCSISIRGDLKAGGFRNNYEAVEDYSVPLSPN